MAVPQPLQAHYLQNPGRAPPSSGGHTLPAVCRTKADPTWGWHELQTMSSRQPQPQRSFSEEDKKCRGSNSQQTAIHMKSLSPHAPRAHSMPQTTPKIPSVGLGVWGTLPTLSPLKAAPDSLTTKSPHSSILQISLPHPSTLSVHRPLGASEPQHPRDTAKGLTHRASRVAASIGGTGREPALAGW